jgi:PPOX class probable F420-dependent enzyme
MRRLERLERLKRLELSAGVLRLLRSARIAHLATADADGHPHVIPICFVYDGKCFFSPIDEKPKRTAPRQLKRLRNIRDNPHVGLIVDRYDEDWSKLAYMLVLGTARVLSTGQRHRKAVRLMRRKYPQYRSMAIHDRPMIVIRPNRVITWGRL